MALEYELQFLKNFLCIKIVNNCVVGREGKLNKLAQAARTYGYLTRLFVNRPRLRGARPGSPHLKMSFSRPRSL